MQQKEEEEQPPCALDLLDVLLQLPLDVVNDNIYKPLVKGDRWAGRSAAGSTLHGVCCQSRTLADHLRTSCSMYSDAGTGPLEGKGLEAWHKDVGERAAYLCCLPRLTRLSLQHAHSDATLATLLTQYGHATQNRLRSLALHCDTFGAAAGSALAVAWPQLQSLSLVIEAALEDDAFLPLKDVSTLTSLLMHGHCAVSDNALRSLGKVTSLEEMEVTLELLPSNQLRHLASLTNLRDLVVDINDTLPCFAAASPLFALTRLTLLELPGVAPGAGHEPSPADDDVQLAQACAALGNLRELHSLDFSQGKERSHVVVGDMLFASLRSLTKLTSLHVGRIELTHPQPGCLPALRHLMLDQGMRPSSVLQSLLPLLPLTLLEKWGIEEGELIIDFSCSDAASAAPEADALKKVAQHLGAAVSLGPLQVKAMKGTQVQWPHLMASQIAEGLHPLLGKMRSLSLGGLSGMGAPTCALLGARLRGLTHLSLTRCVLSDAALAVLVCRWSSLRGLKISRCSGYTMEGWLGLAAGRVDELHVATKHPALSAIEVAQCQAMQLYVFDKCSLTFHGCQGAWSWL